MYLLNPIAVQDVIDIGDACVFLSSDDIEKQSVFGNPYPIRNLPLAIMTATDILKFSYANNSYDPNINSLSHYLLSLCGKYITPAERLIGNKNGIVVGTSEQVNQLILPRDYPQIVVDKAGSLVQDGDTTFTILDPDAAPNGKIAAWAFVEGKLVDDADATILDQMTIQPQWIAGTGYKFTLENGAVFQTDQVIKLQYPVFQNLSIPLGTSGTQDLSFYATLDGDETKSLLNTKGFIFIVPMNAFEVVSFTLFCVSTAGERQSLYWQGQVYNNAGTIELYEAVRTSLGATPFGENFFQTPANGGNLTVAADSSSQGIRVTITGITDKIINCEAQFKFSPANI